MIDEAASANQGIMEGYKSFEFLGFEKPVEFHPLYEPNLKQFVDFKMDYSGQNSEFHKIYMANHMKRI